MFCHGVYEQMNRHVVLTSILLLFSVASQAGAGFFGVRGHTWEYFTDTEKLAYVAGAMDGLIVAGPDAREKHIPLNLSASQYVDGLDDLYGNPRNTIIPAFFLIRIVSLEIQGTDAPVIEEALRALRIEMASQK